MPGPTATSAGAPPATRSRLPGLDGLRGLASVAVVTLHVWMFTGANDPAAPALVDRVIGELRLGLIAFFVLSAFLLTRPWLRAARAGGRPPRSGPFLARRAARILPGYWLAILGAFALLRQSGAERAVSAHDLPVFLLMGQNQVGHLRTQLVPPAWSLTVEMGFYVLLPLLGWLVVRGARRLGPGRAAGALAALLAVAGVGWSWAAYAGGWPPTATSSLPTFLPIFACGIAAAALRAPGAGPARGALLAGGTALVFLDALWHQDGTGALGHVVRDLPAGAGFAMVVAALAAGPPRLLDLAPLRWLGTVSYGTYLWHLPIVFALRAQGLLPADALPALALVLACSLAAGALSFHAVERPALAAVEALLRAPRRRSRRGRGGAVCEPEPARAG